MEEEVLFFVRKMEKKKDIRKKILFWANPYKVGKDGDLENVLWDYKEYIIDKIKKENLDILELKDKTLYCWCVEEKKTYDDNCIDPSKCVCHGQILLRLLHKKINP